MKVHVDRATSNGPPPIGDVEMAIARLLHAVGFNQQRIAALFGCNQGRINECIKGTIGYEGLTVDWEFRVGDRSIEGSDP